MSASPSNNNDHDDDDEGGGADTNPRPGLNNNPFVVAAVGMALLSSDPAATLAAQAARDAGVFSGGAAPAPPTLVLSAATPITSGEPALKDLLGEVRRYVSLCGCRTRRSRRRRRLFVCLLVSVSARRLTACVHNSAAVRVFQVVMYTSYVSYGRFCV